MNEVGRAFAIANLWGQCYNDGTYTNVLLREAQRRGSVRE